MIPIVSEETVRKLGKRWTEQNPKSLEEEAIILAKINPWLATFIATMAAYTTCPKESVEIALGLIELLECAEKENVFRNMIVREEKE